MTKQKLERLAKKLNCQIEFNPMWDILSPKGYCFACDPQCHTIVFEPDPHLGVAEAYEDAYNRLSMGLMKCNCEECLPRRDAWDVAREMRGKKGLVK